MYTTVGYHTVENRNNRVEVLANAPFECTRPDAWLSHGCYFWDKDLAQAHTWGKAAWKNKYMICEVELKLANMLDLLADREHQLFMKGLMQLFQDEHPDATTDAPPCLSEVIAYFRLVNKEREPGFFPFDSIRSYDIPAKHTDVKFVDTKKEVTSLDVRIQICLFEATGSNSRPLTIIFP